VLDQERAVVSGRFDLNIAIDTGQAKPPQAVVVYARMADLELLNLDMRECGPNSADDGFNVVMLAHATFIRCAQRSFHKGDKLTLAKTKLG
jgi:hypothetical protein